jgi:hypothetical protein
MYRNWIKIVTKQCSCGRNSIKEMWGACLGACEGWRRWYWEGEQSPSVLYCGIFHSHNIVEYICTRYNFVLCARLFSVLFWVSYIINKNYGISGCIMGICLLFWKLLCLPSTMCTVNRLSVGISQLPSITPLFPQRHYFRVCPSVDWNW